MNTENRLPHTTLHPELWSKILSHLPPDELSRAANVFHPKAHSASSVGKDKDEVNPLEEVASRIAVESMIHTAVDFFRDTKNMDHDIVSQEEVDRFLETMETSNSSHTNKALGRHKGEVLQWQKIYEDLYMVRGYLITCGFAQKDQTKATAHALLSVFICCKMNGPDDFLQ